MGIRSRAWIGGSLLLGLAGWTGSVRAQDAPTWEVVKRAEGCTLFRSTPAPNASLIAISAYAGSDAVRVRVGVPRMTRRPKDSFPVKLILEGSGKTIAASARAGDIGGPAPAAIETAEISAAEFAPFAKASGLLVTFGNTRLGPFPLPDATDALAAFNECSLEVIVAMSADAAQFEPGGAPPQALKPEDDLLASEHWRTAIAAGLRPGVESIYRLYVDTQGTVSGCTLVDASQSEAVAGAVCRGLVGQLLFKPAHDPSGKAVKGVASFTMKAAVRRDHVGSAPLR